MTRYNGDARDNRFSGSDDEDEMFGEAGNDILIGERGADTLYGGDGDDALAGSRGFDSLEGGDGHDTLDGGDHDDTLEGGRGADVFRFSSGTEDNWGHDIIVDFARSEDFLDFSTAGVTISEIGLEQTDQGTLILAENGGSVLLSGVDVTEINPEQFIFAGADLDSSETNEIQAENYAFSIHHNSTMALLEDGNIVHTWSTDAEEGYRNQIVGRMLDSNGNVLSDVFVISADTGFTVTSPDVTALEGGGFVVIWHMYADGSSYPNQVVAQVYDSSLNPVGENQEVFSDTSSHINQATVTGLLDGGYAVAWNTSFEPFGIYTRQFSADGTPVNEVVQVNTYSNGYVGSPDIAALDHGGYAIAWDSNDSFHTGTAVRIFSAQGEAITNEFSAHSSELGTRGSAPSIATLSDGGFVVTWRLHQGDGNHDLVARVFEETGHTRTDVFAVNTNNVQVNSYGGYDTYNSGDPTVVATPNGGFIISWPTLDQTVSSSSNGSVFRQFDANGNPLADQVVAVSVTGSETSVQAVVLDDDSLLLAWASNEYEDRYNDFATYNTRIVELDNSDDAYATDAGSNVIFGQQTAESYSLLAGHDVVWAYSGHDSLFGGAGNDSLFGGNDNDVLRGDAGEDLLIGGFGHDQLWAGSTDNSADRMYGQAGNDTIGAGAGDDTLSGSTGDDLMFGGDGNDLVDTGDGANTAWAGSGDDQLEGGDGNDILGGGLGNDTIVAGSGNDTIYGGNEDPAGLNDIINAGSGNDTVYAGGGDDSLAAGSGDDDLYSGAGNDTVDGGAGDDTLWGGGGDDTFTGGEDADVFYFGGTSGADTVTDFNVDTDQLVLSATATDFSNHEDIVAAASETDDGLLIDLGGGNSLLLVGLSTNDISDLSIIF